MTKLFTICSLLTTLLTFSSRAATTFTLVDSTGISWNLTVGGLTNSSSFGQFTNGDWWVVAPAIVNSIFPVTDNHKNGSMTNPPVNLVNGNYHVQGFTDWMQSTRYSNTLNFANYLPSTVLPGVSILSCSNQPSFQNGDNPQMQSIAVLTMVASAPASGSFRPTYVGTDKTIYWNASQLNYAVLRNLAAVAHQPAIATVTTQTAHNWVEVDTSWTGRYMHPDLNYRPVDGYQNGTFGRELCYNAANAVLELQGNYTPSQKTPLLINVVQRGIDIYGAFNNGGYWGDGGGHNVGRKMTMLLAATVLGDAGMQSACSNITSFSEDQQTFYVAQSDINLTHIPTSIAVTDLQQYPQSSLGLQEWGFNHKDQPQYDNYSWGGATYRTVAGAPMVGNVLGAMLMGVVPNWNHPVLFDYYTNRFIPSQIGSAQDGANSILLFVADMWNAYSTTGGIPPGGATAVPTIVLNPSSGISLNSITVTLSDATPGATMYYTLDGSNPTTASSRYTAPFPVSSTAVLSVIATSPGNTQSLVASRKIEVNNFLEWGLWHNVPVPSIKTNKVMTFKVNVSTNQINGLIALTQTNFASDYQDMAAIVRFGPAGQVDARNGSAYAAVSTFNYYANSVYWISNFLDVTYSNYWVYASSNGSTWLPIAAHYAYRTEQQPVTNLQNLALYVLAANNPPETMKAYDFQFSSFSGATVPTAPANFRILSSTASSVTLGWDASTNPAVNDYHVYWGGFTGVYTNNVDAGNTTTVTVNSLNLKAAVFFVATDTDTNGVESATSGEVVFMPAPLVQNFQTGSGNVGFQSLNFSSW